LDCFFEVLTPASAAPPKQESFQGQGHTLGSIPLDKATRQNLVADIQQATSRTWKSEAQQQDKQQQDKQQEKQPTATQPAETFTSMGTFLRCLAGFSDVFFSLLLFSLFQPFSFPPTRRFVGVTSGRLAAVTVDRAGRRARVGVPALRRVLALELPHMQPVRTAAEAGSIVGILFQAAPCGSMFRK
jgi:hypothetical protein